MVRNYAVNGLNQYTAAGPAAFLYDPNRNLASTSSAPHIYGLCVKQGSSVAVVGPFQDMGG